jgi:hypothetical protein
MHIFLSWHLPPIHLNKRANVIQKTNCQDAWIAQDVFGTPQAMFNMLYSLTAKMVTNCGWTPSTQNLANLATKRQAPCRLYGLTTSAAWYHDVMSAELRSIGFRHTKVYPELWIRESKTGFEYLATYVDDVFVWSNDPAAFRKYQHLQKKSYNLSFLILSWA